MALPKPIGACPAKADDLTPLVNDKGNNFATEADAHAYFDSNYSDFPPTALCKNTDGTYAINTSVIGNTIEAALQKNMGAGVNQRDLLTQVVSLLASLHKLREVIASAEAGIQELQAQLKTNPQQGLSADDASASFTSVTVEFGIFTFLIGASFYSADLFSSWLLGKMGPMAHLGMANRRAISAKINQFKDQYGLCGSLFSDKAITTLTHILGGCAAAYLSYQSMDALFKYLNSNFYKTSGQAIDPNLLMDPKQMGLVSGTEISKAFAALTGKSEAELTAERDNLLKEFTGYQLRHDALEKSRAELTRVSRERLVARGILKEDGTPATPEGLMAKVFEKSKQAPNETIGMLVGFGVGVGAVAGTLHALKNSNGLQDLNKRALKNAVEAATKHIAQLIESGKLTACKGSTLTQGQLMALANDILRPQSESQQLALSRRGGIHDAQPTAGSINRTPTGGHITHPHVPTSAPKSVQYPVPIQGPMHTWFDDAVPFLDHGEYIQLIDTRLQATFAQWKTIFPAELADSYIAAAKNLVTLYVSDHQRSLLQVSEAMTRFIFQIAEKEITTAGLTVVVAGIRNTVSHTLQSEITRNKLKRAHAERERLHQYVYSGGVANPNLYAAMILIDLEGYALQSSPAVIERINQYLRAFEVETAAVGTASNVVRLPISRATIVSERALATGTDGPRVVARRAAPTYRGGATSTGGRVATVTRLPSATSSRAIPRTGGGNGVAFGRATTALGIAGWALTFVHLAIEGKASGQCDGFFDCMNKGAEIMLTPPPYQYDSFL